MNNNQNQNNNTMMITIMVIMKRILPHLLFAAGKARREIWNTIEIISITL